jgi:hypothetical protein
LTILAKQAFPHKVVTMAEAVKMYSAHLQPSELLAPTLYADISRLRTRAGAEATPGIAAA